MKRRKVISRTPEMALGLIGSVGGLFSGSLLILIRNIEQAHAPFFGVIAIFAALLGILSSCYVKQKTELAGVGFIIATMFVILGSEYINIISALFLLVAGILALFRK
ncbi:hypothetical protein [Methanobrevibacter sp.]|uniref:hypothetical protein n=1 Tax=Methanobrevibacter sp. TaxID=66852 RepID=UPI00388FD7EA